MNPETKLTEYLERIRKRRDHLSIRIEKAKMDGRDLSYDKAEFAALDFTIDLIINNQAVALDYMEQWLSEKGEK